LHGRSAEKYWYGGGAIGKCSRLHKHVCNSICALTAVKEADSTSQAGRDMLTGHVVAFAFWPPPTGFVEPALPSGRSLPPRGGVWLHEIKFDGAPRTPVVRLRPGPVSDTGQAGKRATGDVVEQMGNSLGSRKVKELTDVDP